MANWFKLYETDLDESRLKYALSKLPEVGWVWIGILSECCKHRSDTIRWSDKAHELFGFSDRLKVSIPKVNESINLLCEIDYISLSSGHIKVLKWNEKQSDYCRRKSNGDYAEHPIVSDNIAESPLEYRRLDESRKKQIVRPNASSLASEALDEWNKVDGIKKCLLISSKRRMALEQRFQDPFFKSNWKEALGKVAQSSFCKGGGDRGWKASFDWFIQPDTCLKIMEGKYENAATRTTTNKPNPRNFGVVVGPTDYATAKPRLQREREEAKRLAEQVASNGNNTPASAASAGTAL